MLSEAYVCCLLRQASAGRATRGGTRLPRIAWICCLVSTDMGTVMLSVTPLFLCRVYLFNKFKAPLLLHLLAVRDNRVSLHQPLRRKAQLGTSRLPAVPSWLSVPARRVDDIPYRFHVCPPRSAAPARNVDHKHAHSQCLIVWGVITNVNIASAGHAEHICR